MCSKLRALTVVSVCGMIILFSVVKKYGIQNFKKIHLVNSPSNTTGTGYVGLQWWKGRLGNRMFQVAAQFYAALKTNREVVLFNGHNGYGLVKYFSLAVRRVNRSCPCFLYHEKVLSYDFRIEEAIRSENATNSHTIVLDGFFQSWKYIEPVDHLIRTRLKFQNTIEAFARNILIQAIPNGWTEGRFTRVGIHIRRGDFLRMGYINYGFSTAPESYFKKAMKYFTDRFELVQFIVASDDIKWSRQHIAYDSKSSSVNVTYSVNHSAGQDMAILSFCDHAIISSGTFGYMAAWLANGITVYYSNYPRNGSRFSARLNRSDYYPPHWIPME